MVSIMADNLIQCLHWVFFFIFVLLKFTLLFKFFRTSIPNLHHLIYCLFPVMQVFWCTCLFFFFTFKQYKLVLTITGMHIRSFHDLVHGLYYYVGFRYNISILVCIAYLDGGVTGRSRVPACFTLRHSYRRWSLNCSNSDWVSQVNNSLSVGIFTSLSEYFLRVLPISIY